MTWTWTVNDKTVTGIKQIGEHIIKMQARNIREDKSSRKLATVSIYFNTLLLEEDDISLQKREDRNRLANSAHKQMPERLPQWSDVQAKSDLMNFSREVWDRHIGSTTVTKTKGSSRTEIPWLLEPFCIRGAGTILFAPPSSGKSFIGLVISIILDSGVDALWKPEQPARVLYVNLERSEDSFERRIGRINESLGLPEGRSLDMIHGRGLTLAQLHTQIAYAIENEKYKLVVLDSLSRAGSSLVLDDQANAVMDQLNFYGREHGCAWLALAHTPRADSDHIFGSQMFTAAADIEWKATAKKEIGEGEEEGITFLYQKFENKKSNDFDWQKPEYLVYEMDKFGPENIRLIHPSDFPEDEEEDEKVTSPPTRELKPSELSLIEQKGRITAAEFQRETGLSNAQSQRLLFGSKYLERDESFKGRAIYYTLIKKEEPHTQHPLSM